VDDEAMAVGADAIKLTIVPLLRKPPEAQKLSVLRSRADAVFVSRL